MKRGENRDGAEPEDPRIGILTVSIKEPGSTADVEEEGYQGSCTGWVCVKGTAEKSGTTVSTVMVQCNSNSPLPAEVEGKDWHIKVRGARCVCNGQPGNNTVFAIARYADGGMEFQSVNFKGNCVSGSIQCNGAATDEDGTRKDASSYGEIVEPSVIDNGWLEYSSLLSPDPLSFGKVLGFNGRPLAARTIAVYASHVCWYNHGGRAVRRAIGSVADVAKAVTPNGVVYPCEPWRFHDIPKESICLFQPGGLSHQAETRNVVVSECCEKPDVFDVFPDQPIVTRVNDSYFPLTPHTGTYSLRVKVL